MPFTDGATFKTNLQKYKSLVVNMAKSTKDARLRLLQGDKTVALVNCSNCKAGDTIRVPLQGIDPLTAELKLQGEGEMESFDITKLI